MKFDSRSAQTIYFQAKSLWWAASLVKQDKLVKFDRHLFLLSPCSSTVNGENTCSRGGGAYTGEKGWCILGKTVDLYKLPSPSLTANHVINTAEIPFHPKYDQKDRLDPFLRWKKERHFHPFASSICSMAIRPHQRPQRQHKVHHAILQKRAQDFWGYFFIYADSSPKTQVSHVRSKVLRIHEISKGAPGKGKFFFSNWTRSCGY